MVRTIMRVTFAPLIILLVVLAAVVYGAYTVSVSAPDEVVSSDVPEAMATSTDTVSSGNDATSVGETTEQPASHATLPSAGSSDKATAPSGSGPTTFVTLPYDVILYSTMHYIAWSAPSTLTATLHLRTSDKDLGPLEGCSDMPATGSREYCAWQQNPIPYAPMTGYRLALVLKNAAGQEVQTVKSAPFSFMRRSELLLTPVENTTYGFEIRYPDYWQVKEYPDKLVIGAGADALRAPGSSLEAVTIEVCSTARESCAKRVGDHTARTARQSALGGKQSRMVVTSGGSPVRTDLLERDGLAYFVTRRAANKDGIVHSPYVRAVTDSFDFSSPRVTVTRYDVDDINGNKMLLVERTNNTVSYVRLYTGGRACFGEIATGVFTIAEARRFDFSQGSCVIQGRLSGDVYAIDENRCTAFHGPECAFTGRYELNK